MKKIAFVLAVAASLLFVSAEAMPDKKKGNEKERRVPVPGLPV